MLNTVACFIDLLSASAKFSSYWVVMLAAAGGGGGPGPPPPLLREMAFMEEFKNIIEIMVVKNKVTTINILLLSFGITFTDVQVEV